MRKSIYLPPIILTLVFIVLFIFDLIVWPWYLLIAPIIIYFGMGILGFIVIYVAVSIQLEWHNWKRKHASKNIT